MTDDEEKRASDAIRRAAKAMDALDEKPSLGASCLGAIFAAIAWPFLVAWHAYAVLVLWGWFIAPLNLIATPSIYVLAGALMTIKLALFPLPAHSLESQTTSVRIAYAVAIPAIAIAFGWLWQWLHWWA